MISHIDMDAMREIEGQEGDTSTDQQTYTIRVRVLTEFRVDADSQEEALTLVHESCGALELIDHYHSETLDILSTEILG